MKSILRFALGALAAVALATPALAQQELARLAYNLESASQHLADLSWDLSTQAQALAWSARDLGYDATQGRDPLELQRDFDLVDRDYRDLSYYAGSRSWPYDVQYALYDVRVAYDQLARWRPGPGPGPGPSPQLAPVFRFFNGRDHLLTLDYGEGTRGGYRYEGQLFRIAPQAQEPGMHPLYRCVVPVNADHFVSTAANCEGQRTEASYGWVYDAQRPGTLQLWRCYRLQGSFSDHLATTDSAECARAGYRVEGPLGWVIP